MDDFVASPINVKELRKQALDGRYLSTLMDVLDDTAIYSHPEYKFKPSYDDPRFSLIRKSPHEEMKAGTMSSPSDVDRPRTSESARSRGSRGSSRSPSKVDRRDLPPSEFLSTFEDRLVPYSESLDPIHGSLDYTKYVGDKIREQVGEGVREWAKYANGEGGEEEKPFSRCVVCTLPFGTCQHTREWLGTAGSRFRSSSGGLVNDWGDPVGGPEILDLEDVLRVGSEGLNEELKRGVRTQAFPLTNISSMHWTKVICRDADEIEGRKMDLSSPPCMLGSTGVMIPNPVGQPHLVVHGGVRYGGGGVFKAYETALVGASKRAVYEGRTFVYNMVEMTWHDIPKGGEQDPPGRYGHCAVALPDRTMWTFGGRQRAGVFGDDVHVWNFDKASWRKVEYDRNIVRVPAPRCGAQAAYVPGEGKAGSVVMFGGRDGTRNFGDLWIYDVATTDWAEPVCMGVPPCPRHGHSVLALDEGRIMVLGGCGVSPMAETGTPENMDELDDKMQAAAARVEECYRMERAEAEVAGAVLETEADYRGWRELARLSAQAAAAVAKREKDTADAESDLDAIMKERSAAVHWAKMNSRHGTASLGGVHDGKYMDVTLLDVQAKVWTEPTAPPCTGRLPPARMEHAAVAMAGKVIVIGGRSPTGGTVAMSDGDVHVLDVESWRWSAPAVEDTRASMLPTLDAAGAAVRRAKAVLEDEKAAAMSRGVPGGRSVEAAEAEAVEKVCKWRLGRLQETCRNVKEQPPPRYGHAAVPLGQRIYFVGGCEEDRAVGSGKEMVVLDLEQPDERERRLREEFHARLERERRIQEFKEEQERKQREYEERVQREKDEKRRLEEVKRMEFEDMLSRLPPKTFAPAPRLKFANKNTIWLRWDPVLVNSRNERIRKGEVTYILYSRGGYQHLEKGVRVVVKSVKEEAGGGRGGGGGRSRGRRGGGGGTGEDGSSLGDGSSVDTSTFEGGSLTTETTLATGSAGGGRVEGMWYPGVVAGVHLKGTFDVKYDGGGKEKRVARGRIRLEKEPVWEVVYRGAECGYAVEASVPDVVLEREEGIQVEMEFVLQTLGTEYPVEEPSLHGEQMTHSTVNRDREVRDFMEMMKEGEGGKEMTDQESRAKKKIMEAIEIDGGVIQSWYKGKTVEGTGTGTHFV
ncbi:hypothetical protein TrCOL_g992 [Triparma columacea]|uniref:Uncharacterized protein n=1 Tax=Triparma columacea TaxID=722753 RepID=A0A9W7FTQ4_9STRA|nr:hypothetical protein TrCOL_g992 [Triparma columacea]